MTTSLRSAPETPAAPNDPALAELARRTAMLGAIGYAATRIVGGRDWRAGIQELLDRLGAAMRVSRVSLFETHRGPDGKLAQSCRWDWGEPGLPKISDNPLYQNMSLADEEGGPELGDWSVRRQRGEVVQAMLRDTTGYTRQVFEEHGTLSFLSVPIMVEGRWWGFIGFDECREERIWSDLEIEVLRTAAALVAGAIERAEAHEKLRLSEERYALVARGGNDGLYDWDMVAGTTYYSPRLHELLGVPDDDLGTDPDSFFRCMVPEDAIRVRAELDADFAEQRRQFEFECRCRCAGRQQWFVSRGAVLYEDGHPIRVVGQVRDISARKTAEAQMRESEERFRTIAGTVPLAISISRPDGRLIFTNAQWSVIFGVPPERAGEVVTRDFYETGEERDRLMTDLAAGNGVEGVGARLKRAGGEVFWALISIRPITYQGEPALLSAITDITVLKEAETALRESETNVRAILDTALDAIVTTDEAGAILEFNPAAERMFGYTRAAMLGQRVDETIFPPHTRPLRAAALRRALEAGENQLSGQRLELDAMRADGLTVPVEVAIAAVPLADRVGFTAFLRDISERKRVEQELSAYRESLEQLVERRTAALAAAESRLRAAIGTFQGGFALYDAHERLIIANENCRTLMPDADSVLMPGSMLEDFVRGAADANRLGADWVADEMSRFRNGEDFSVERETYEGRWIELRAAHMADGGLLLVITDISAYRMAEQALRTALAKERQFGQLQREFVSMTSHEFRTPLAIIDTATQRLMRRREQLSGEEYGELGREVRDAVQRMIGMIDGILNSARLDAGEIRFSPRPMELAALIDEVCRRQAALSPRHDIRTELAGLPAEIAADRALLDQVFTNLLSNATKYAPNGGPVDVAGRLDGNAVVVTVTDRGVGIPKADLPRLFERFFRARTSTGIGGTGIGLYAVKRLVQMHGGSVAVASTEGEGTTVTVRLPLQPSTRGGGS
jgi:PAS domain S-box-containing protein